MMRLGLAANPAQHEVDRWNKFNFNCVRIHRVFASGKGRAPDTLVTGFDLFTVAERFSSGVISRGAVIGNNYANVTNGDQGFGFDLDRPKPTVDEKRTVSQHLQLFTTLASQLEERFWILEIVVIFSSNRLDLGSDDFTRSNCWAVLNTHHADGIEVRIELRSIRDH